MISHIKLGTMAFATSLGLALTAQAHASGWDTGTYFGFDPSGNPWLTVAAVPNNGDLVYGVSSTYDSTLDGYDVYLTNVANFTYAKVTGHAANTDQYQNIISVDETGHLYLTDNSYLVWGQSGGSPCPTQPSACVWKQYTTASYNCNLSLTISNENTGYTTLWGTACQPNNNFGQTIWNAHTTTDTWKEKIINNQSVNATGIYTDDKSGYVWATPDGEGIEIIPPTGNPKNTNFPSPSCVSYVAPVSATKAYAVDCTPASIGLAQGYQVWETNNSSGTSWKKLSGVIAAQIAYSPNNGHSGNTSGVIWALDLSGGLYQWSCTSGC
jgi:hypothetical protein